MKEKERPFYLGIEGFEAGHSAAESLTNSAQTSACTTSDGREWRHEKTGLVISVINDHDTHSVENVQSDRLQIKNKGKKPVTISHFSATSIHGNLSGLSAGNGDSLFFELLAK